VRFGSAEAALESGDTITEAAERVGYGSCETLRRAFVTRLGVSPSAYQQRFRSAQRRDAVAGDGASRTR
jgi:AraC-like DNA-binding protein